MARYRLKPQSRRQSLGISALFSGLLLILAACGTFEVGLVSTPTATPSASRYENTDYGFAFVYPSTWTLEASPHEIHLRKGSLTLRVAFKRVDEAVEIGADIGIPTEGTVYVQKLTFLGHTMPGVATIYDRKFKAVAYEPPRPVTSQDLVFAISLTDPSGSGDPDGYAAIDISDTVLEEVGSILESFERVPPADVSPSSSEPATPALVEAPRPTMAAGWAHYVNAEYGFGFNYPPTWELTQVSGGEVTPFGPLADAVRLTQGDVMLTIQVQRTGETHYLGTGEAVAGALVQSGPVDFMGTPTNQRLLILQDRVRQLSLRYKGQKLEFFVLLGPAPGPGLPDEAFALSEEIQSEAAAILQSFTPYP